MERQSGAWRRGRAAGAVSSTAPSVGSLVSVTLISALVLSACLGDPPPDPATAPLEVVLEGCRLNRDEVGAGRHEVSVIGEGRLSVQDAAGSEVLSVDGGGMASLTTTEQTYTFRCQRGDEESSTQLMSRDS